MFPAVSELEKYLVKNQVHVHELQVQVQVLLFQVQVQIHQIWT